MIKISKNSKNSNISFIGLIWVSSILALIFTLPTLGVILGIHHYTGNWILGIVFGVLIHFITLIFAGRISKFLIRIMTEVGDQS